MLLVIFLQVVKFIVVDTVVVCLMYRLPIENGDRAVQKFFENKMPVATDIAEVSCIGTWP